MESVKISFFNSTWRQTMNRNEILKQVLDQKSYMEDRIKDGISARQKGVFVYPRIDGSNDNLAGTKMTVHQKNHEFKHGANIFMLDEMETPEKNEAYKTNFASTFNLATLPFYWNTLEPERNQPRYSKSSPRIYRRPAPDICIDYCMANRIEPKAHCLNYSSLVPGWLPANRPQELKMLLAKRFQELSERYAQRVPMWEVTNETFWHSDMPQFPIYNDPEFVEWSFKMAETYFPGNKLVINEAHCCIFNQNPYQTNRTQYYMQIERALLKGARIDGIGLPFHMFHTLENATNAASYYSPLNMYNVLDSFAKLNKPLQITEITIPAYTDKQEDEELQAEIMRYLYSMWFSHPAMEGIIYWNLTDGYGWNAEPGDMNAGENYYRGGLMRFDMTPKPALKVIQDLFTKEWHTEKTFDINADSYGYFKGFCGDYEAELETPNGLYAGSFSLVSSYQHNVICNFEKVEQ